MDQINSLSITKPTNLSSSTISPTRVNLLHSHSLAVQFELIRHCVSTLLPTQSCAYILRIRLGESIEKGCGPDGGNPDVDGDVMWSFVEYFYEPGASRYTFDLSYIDEFSYPVTAKFSNVGSYGGAVEGHEYGPKRMSSIRSALEQQGSGWKGLIWPINGSTSLWHQWPGLYRGKSFIFLTFHSSPEHLLTVALFCTLMIVSISGRPEQSLAILPKRW